MWTLWEESPRAESELKHNFFESKDDAEEDRTVGGALECDYQKDCIPLYKKIEEEQFGAVVDFLNTGYWPGTFFQDPISPLDQARTWVTRFEYKERKRVRWSQLPLHVAIVVEAPLVLIKTLVELYPQATRCTDDQRMLPLHLALRHGCKEEIVAYLLRKFPEAVNVRGGKGDGRLPVEYAIRGPNKTLGDILETFVEKSNAKATKVAAKNHAKDLEFFQAKLQAKEFELANVKEKLTSIDEEKLVLEEELASKRQELKVSMKNMEKLSALKLKEIEETGNVEEEVRKRIDELEENGRMTVKQSESEQGSLIKQIEHLESQKIALSRSQTKAKQEELGLLEELESVLDESIQELKKRSYEETALTSFDTSQQVSESDSEEERTEAGMEAEAREDDDTTTVTLTPVGEIHHKDERSDNGDAPGYKSEEDIDDETQRDTEEQFAKKSSFASSKQKIIGKSRDDDATMSSRSIVKQPLSTESQKEIDALRSEVERLRFELERKTIEHKNAMHNTPVRTKASIFKRKKHKPLAGAPTV